MIGLVLGMMTYFFTETGHFGGDIVAALSMVESWYYVCLFIIGVIAALVFVGVNLAFVSQKVTSKAEQVGWTIAGVTVSSILAGIILFRVVVMLLITQWLIGDINVLSDDLTNKQLLAIIFLICLAVSTTFKISDNKK